MVVNFHTVPLSASGLNDLKKVGNDLSQTKCNLGVNLQARYLFKSNEYFPKKNEQIIAFVRLMWRLSAA